MALFRALPAYAEAVYIDSYNWQVDNRHFGGFSALELSADGTSFIALTDRAYIGRGTIMRDGDRIVDVRLDLLRSLLGPTRAPLADEFTDSEGLAVAQDGTIHISFEGADGLRAFADVDKPGSELNEAPAFFDFQDNSGLEALAIGPDGALYTMPERSGLATRPFPVFRYKDGIWDQPFSIARTGPYLICGADIGPDGKLYILERDFIGIGFRSRVRRFDLAGGSGEVILTTGLRTHDNLEGISVWQDAEGMRMTLISDDNFRSFQRTEIVEYRLTD